MASWYSILTERDKQHLAALGPAPRRGYGRKPALLVVDDYYASVGDEPLPILESIKTWPASCGQEGWEAIWKTKELLKAARDAQIPVVYCHQLDSFPIPWARSRRNERPDLPEKVRRMGNDIVADIAPAPGEYVLQKSSPSAFFGTLLAAYLISQGVDTLITCGETTSGCVRASVVDGCSYRFRMAVVEECTFDRTQASHLVNLFDMNQKYADVVSLEDACEYLGGLRAPERRELQATAVVR